MIKKYNMFKLEKNVELTILERYLKGESAKEIALDFEYSKYVIYRLLRNKNIVRRNRVDCHKKYEIDDHYFTIIDSEDKAYFLGLMFADGYNNEIKGEAKITLQTGDTEILNIFREKLKTDKPLRLDRKYHKLALENKQISKDLAKHGCVQAKTFKLKFPKLRENLVRHFIRGYFDGDGCITIMNKKYPQISIVGTKDFLVTLQNILIKELGLFKTKLSTRHPERNHNIRTLFYGSYGNCLPIYYYFYDKSTIFLSRKKNKFETIFKNLRIEYYVTN
jgi:hypothetical protein